MPTGALLTLATTSITIKLHVSNTLSLELEYNLKTRPTNKCGKYSDLKIGKAIVYSFVDLLHPKRADQVTCLLDRFQHHGNDVDNLTLIMTNSHTEKHKTSVL